MPCRPWGPCGPVAPCGPSGPCNPSGPCGPCGPTGPGGPSGWCNSSTTRPPSSTTSTETRCASISSSETCSAIAIDYHRSRKANVEVGGALKPVVPVSAWLDHQEVPHAVFHHCCGLWVLQNQLEQARRLIDPLHGQIGVLCDSPPVPHLRHQLVASRIQRLVVSLESQPLPEGSPLRNHDVVAGRPDHRLLVRWSISSTPWCPSGCGSRTR
ncbi:MAG: hypothetical protein EBR33_06855 [Synechococcaceae bacterium WB4_1_0192]|nr:hypothetical protein [Synechococcaceae bacterium WB4_1_0192]